GGRTAELRVYGIAARTGPGAYTSPPSTFGGPLTAYLPLATAQLVTGDQDITVVRIAARSGGSSDTAPARRAASPLRSAVGRLPAGPPPGANRGRAGRPERVAG